MRNTSFIVMSYPVGKMQLLVYSFHFNVNCVHIYRFMMIAIYVKIYAKNNTQICQYYRNEF